MMEKIKVIVEKTRSGYTAYTDDYPAMATGENMKELKATMVDELNTFLVEQGKKVEVDGFIFYFEINGKREGTN